MKKILLNLYICFFFFVLTLIGIIVLPLILAFNRIFLARKIEAALRRAIRFYGWVLVRLLPFFGPVSVQYPEVELELPAIFVANHNSAIDPYLFGTIAVENSFVTSWPFKIPVYGWFMKLAGYANTLEGWDRVREKASALLAAGCSVTIWPEGHRSRDGKLNRFKKGAFALAVETGRPVVPVCILGSGRILPPGARLLNPGRARLLVLDPVYPEVQVDREMAIRNLRRKARTMIETTLQQHGHFDEASSNRSQTPCR